MRTAFMPSMSMQTMGTDMIDLFWYMPVDGPDQTGKKYADELNRKASNGLKRVISQLRQRKINAPVVDHPRAARDGEYFPPNLVFARRVMTSRLSNEEFRLVEKILHGVGFDKKPLSVAASVGGQMDLISRVAGLRLAGLKIGDWFVQRENGIWGLVVGVHKNGSPLAVTYSDFHRKPKQESVGSFHPTPDVVRESEVPSDMKRKIEVAAKSGKFNVASELVRVARLLTGYTVFSPETLAAEILKKFKRELAANSDYDTYSYDELKVDYSIFGSHRPATRWEPEEYPELDEITVDSNYCDLEFDLRTLEGFGIRTTIDVVQKAVPLISKVLMGKGFIFWADSTIGVIQFSGKVVKVWTAQKKLFVRMGHLEATDNKRNEEAVWEHAEDHKNDWYDGE